MMPAGAGGAGAGERFDRDGERDGGVGAWMGPGRVAGGATHGAGEIAPGNAGGR